MGSKRTGGRPARRVKPVGVPKGSDVRRRDRRWLFVGLGVGLVLVVAVLVVWRISTDRGGEEDAAAEIGAFGEQTADARTELGNVAAELQDLTLTAQGDGEPAVFAVEAAPDVAERATALTGAFLSVPVGDDLALTKQLYVAAARSLTEGARSLSLAITTDPVQDDRLVNSAGRIAAIGTALRVSADESFAALERGDTFVALPQDVPAQPEMDQFPADILPATRAPAFEVTREIQEDGAWVEEIRVPLGDADTALAGTGEAVRGFEVTEDATILEQDAAVWFDAAAGALARLSEARRPDTLQDADVALRDTMWLLEESARAFAAVPGIPMQTMGLMRVGAALRLTSEELWAAAAGRTERVTGEELPGPPPSGFDPMLVDPDRRPPGTEETPEAGDSVPDSGP
ncbi:MAG: hypothetical protein IT198_03720 [Acidimicrobiia bacterium]|nr:hypothetical protein [Acidimicrobiia bacterium]